MVKMKRTPSKEFGKIRSQNQFRSQSASPARRGPQRRLPPVPKNHSRYLKKSQLRAIMFGKNAFFEFTNCIDLLLSVALL